MKAVRKEKERDLLPTCRQKSLLKGFEREGLTDCGLQINQNLSPNRLMCGNCALLGYEAVNSRNFLPVFQGNLLFPTTRAQPLKAALGSSA